MKLRVGMTNSEIIQKIREFNNREGRPIPPQKILYWKKFSNERLENLYRDIVIFKTYPDVRKKYPESDHDFNVRQGF